MRFRDDMLRPKVLVFMLPLLLPIGQPRTSATGLNGADADSRPTEAPSAWVEPDPDTGGRQAP